MKLNLPAPQAFPRLSGEQGLETSEKREWRMMGTITGRPFAPAIFTWKTFDYNYQNSFRFCSLLCQSCWGLKSNNPNMHKKTTNWRILVVVVKWRHRATVSPANCRRISGRRFSSFGGREATTGNAPAVRRLAIVLLTQISPKRAIASYWWILVVSSKCQPEAHWLSNNFFCVLVVWTFE